VLNSIKIATVFLPLILLLHSPVDVFAANPVQTENALTGTGNWVLQNPATSREIEGYASLTSVNIGGTIKFFISTNGPYTIDIYRMGWYGGLGAREMPNSHVQLTGTIQPTPTPTADDRLIECNWTVSHTLSVPNDWVSGVYVAKLTQLSSTKQSYIIFVVRDDDRASDYLFQSSVTTFQAYNNWPGKLNRGKSLYEHNSSSEDPDPSVRDACNADAACHNGVRATKVSFNRPYAIESGAGDTLHPGPASGVGAGEFFTVTNGPVATSITYSAAWEYNMVRFLESKDLDVTYSTDIDTHANGQNLLSHKGFISVGHDEYWSLEMRNNVEAARDSGVSLGFFGSNTAYWQIRLEANNNGNGTEPYRTVVCYKYVNPNETGGPRDPIASDPLRITVKWRDPVLNRPEDELIGVMTDLALAGSEKNVDSDIVITDPSHPVFGGIKFQNNRLPGLLGYEVDRKFSNASTDILANSPTPSGPGSDMTIYTMPNGAIVFATGSMQWSWGLDNYNATTDFNSPVLRPSRLSTAAQQITLNVLNGMRRPDSSSRFTTAAATFVGEDNTTQGNWKGVYGADGYNVIDDAQNYPAYAQVSVSGQTLYTEPNASSADVRWLQKAANGSPDRNFSSWFSATNFTIDINLTDGREHRVTLYCLDWDENDGRSQKIEVLDADTNAVLATRDVDDFSLGRYLIWKLTGHVKIKVTNNGVAVSNAVINGLFFGLNGSATFVEEDNTKQGNWKGVYGADGYNVIGDMQSYPAYAQVSLSGQTPNTWAASTSDVRALQKAANGSTDRIAASLFSPTDFTIDINLTDGQEHRVALYVLDWDGNNLRSQRIEVLDAATDDVLATRNVDDFSSGRYLVWRLKGHVKIKVINRDVPHSNAVVSGLFFDTPLSTATFVEEDDTRQGNWKGVYGVDGFNIIDDAQLYPTYAQVSVSGETLYTEPNASSSDVRWLQKAANGSTDRNFSSWFSATNFTIDINLTDGQEHRVAVYCLDWDENDGRSQKIEVLDAATNVVLATRDVDDFSSGRYLVWRLRGHVKIKVTNRGAAVSNAVVSGLFFN
jgi:hypothetical protein